MFIWDDELDGQPPYVRKIGHETINLLLDSIDAASHNGAICSGCNCLKLLKDLHNVVKELQYKMREDEDETTQLDENLQDF